MKDDIMNGSISNRLSNIFSGHGGEIFHIPGLDDDDTFNMNKMKR